MKKICSLLLMLAILLACFSGCGQADEPQGETEMTPSSTDDGSIVLWVLTDITLWDGMNSQVKDLMNAFKHNNDNITVNLEILPMDAQERETRLEKLRAEILAGRGPDVYLLPTNNYLRLVGSNMVEDSYLIEPLFSDAEMTMHNGHFADISTYYDADDDLNKDGLITKVMDAGVIDDERYILPLRYNIPVLYADTKRLAEFEVDQERLYSGNIMDLIDLAIETEDQLLAGGAVSALQQRGLILSLFPDAIDYDKVKLNLRQEELVAFLVKLQQVNALTKGDYAHNYAVSVDRYIKNKESLSSRRYPIKQGMLDEVIAVISVSKATGDDITMIPLRAIDGSLVAHVTYYGAVGSSCENPEVAYEFLRLFLQEDAQWEYDRQLTKDHSYAHANFIDDGWPVRAMGAVEHLEETCIRGLSLAYQRKEDTKLRADDVINVDLSEEDVHDLITAQIDEVRFRIPLEWDLRTVMSSDADVDEVAEEMIYMLELHLAEG